MSKVKRAVLAFSILFAFALCPWTRGGAAQSAKQGFGVEVVAKDLETPWGLAFLPDGRLLVTERPGRMRIIEKDTLLPPVSGIPAVWTVQDGGLFDVEVHPDYGRNGWIYLAYAEPAHGGSMTVAVRGRIRGNAWVDQQIIFKAPAEYYTDRNYHYGLRFTFASDRTLFYSIGDKGRPSDAQDLSKPTGKIHRVNDDGSAAAGNPFTGKPGALATIWSYGHRNPQGLALDPATGQLWATEHGPQGGDELNRIEPGANYGWPLASHGKEPGVKSADHPGTVPPVAHWTPTMAPAGMAFYTGKRYPPWRNQLFVACLAGQQLRRLEVASSRVAQQQVVSADLGRVRDVVVGPDDLLYVAVSSPGNVPAATTAGAVLRLLPQ
jgi:glucose/arabinose dehydrogenase